MKSGRKNYIYIVYIILGITLFVLGSMGIVDEFWCGMGGGLIMISILRLIQVLRYRKNETYREKMEIEIQDERNRFIRNKAWAWTGYMFVLIAGVCTIVFKIIGQELLSFAASYSVCLMLILYWISYLFLRKKY